MWRQISDAFYVNALVTFIALDPDMTYTFWEYYDASQMLLMGGEL
jgi:hypothetical protein